MKTPTTKAELKAEIERLEGVVREQRRALDLLGADTGMEVILPFAPHAGFNGAAGYISGRQFSSEVLPIVVEAIRKHGVEVQCETKSELRLGECMYARGPTFVIPRLVGLMLIDFLDAAGSFSHACHKQGFKDGSDLLTRLAEGELTADQFDDSRQQELAREAQAYKRFANQERVYAKS